MVVLHEDWLQLVKEEALEPGLPICDAHHHLWNFSDRRYVVEDYLRDIGVGHNILQSVFVECAAGYRQSGLDKLKPVGETEFVINLVKKNHGRTRIASAIIGFADLTLGEEVAEVLEAHIAVGEGRFRGIRQQSIWDASPDVKPAWITPNIKNQKELLLDNKFREGFACLKRYGLSFDAWMYHTQLTELLDLAKHFQNTIIILNHAGTPLGIGPYAGNHDDVVAAWKRDIAALAKCDNVYIKLGGLGMPRCGFGWSVQKKPPDSIEVAMVTAPYYLWCIDKFGVDRCMFESNFPVDKQSYSYNIVWNSFKRMTNEFSSEERLALFYNNAMKVYRI